MHGRCSHCSREAHRCPVAVEAKQKRIIANAGKGRPVYIQGSKYVTNRFPSASAAEFYGKGSEDDY